MSLGRLFRREVLDVPCRLEIENTFESLHAHVRLEGGVVIHPGDEVEVQGAPVRVPFGECRTIERRATIRRAGPLERLWTRLTGDFEFMELCEFSFSEERLS